MIAEESVYYRLVQRLGSRQRIIDENTIQEEGDFRKLYFVIIDQLKEVRQALRKHEAVFNQKTITQAQVAGFVAVTKRVMAELQYLKSLQQPRFKIIREHAEELRNRLQEFYERIIENKFRDFQEADATFYEEVVRVFENLILKDLEQAYKSNEAIRKELLREV